MPMIRRLTIGLALTALAPAIVEAQDGSRFTNSWFWGVKASNMTFWTTRIKHGQAQGLGGEWLLTRTHGALLLSGEYYSFGDPFDMTDSDPSSINGQRVDMRSMRRVSASMLTFPKNFGGLRPYAGVGFSFNYLDARVPSGSAVAGSDLRDAKGTIAPQALLGVQAQYRRFSIFGQGTYLWAQGNKFLLNDNATYLLDAGIRVNFGSSIDRTL